MLYNLRLAGDINLRTARYSEKGKSFMKTALCLTLTLLIFGTPTFVSNGFAQIGSQQNTDKAPIDSPILFVDIGVFRTVIPVEVLDNKKVSASGIGIGWSGEKRPYAFEMGSRLAYGKTQSGERVSDYFSVSLLLGGRYFFFSRQNISPYIGGGFGRMSVFLSTNTSNPIYSEEKTGLGVYGVIGAEFPRFSKNRLKIELRVDRPIFEMPSQDVMPITLGITYSTNNLFGLFGDGI